MHSNISINVSTANQQIILTLNSSGLLKNSSSLDLDALNEALNDDRLTDLKQDICRIVAQKLEVNFVEHKNIYLFKVTYYICC